MYDKLIIKVNAINIKIRSTGGLVSKNQYNADKEGLEKTENLDKNILNNSKIVKKTDSTKIKETGNTGIVNAFAVCIVIEIENEIPDNTSFILSFFKKKQRILRLKINENCT